MQVDVDPTNWAPGSPMNYALQVGARQYTVYNAGSGMRYNINNNWALTSTDNNTLRFEVRRGDTNWYDQGSGKERSEIGSQQLINYGTPMEVKYKFDMASAEKNSATWMVIGQIHQTFPDGTPASPPFAINLKGEQMQANIRYNDANGNVVQKDFPIGGDIVRGQTYDMDIKAVFDGQGNGRLIVSRDGVVYVDYSGPLGYSKPSQTYWKEGIYRYGGKGETQVAEYSNLQITSGDAVQLPAKGAAYHAPAAAPTVAYDHGDVQGSGAKVAFTGTAVAGQVVTLYDGGTTLGTTVADAQGHYALTIDMVAGRHYVAATTTDADGFKSVVSGEVPVEIGTAGEILGRMEVLPMEHGLAAIFLTDTHVMTVASVAQMQSLIATGQSALSKIEGGYSFQLWSGVKGNRTVTSYDAKGNTIDAVNVVSDGSGQVIRMTDYHPAGTSAYAREVFSYTPGNSAMKYQAFDAAGKMLVLAYTDANGKMIAKTVYNADGSSVADSYSASGQVTETVTQASGAVTRSVLSGLVDVTKPLFPTAPAIKVPVDPQTVPASQPVSSPALPPSSPDDGSSSPVSGQPSQPTGGSGSTGTPSQPSQPAPAPAVAAPTQLKAEPKDGAVVLSGNGTAGQTVTLYDGGKAVGSAIVGSDGHFSTSLTLVAGSHALQATITGASGGVSPLSSGVGVEIGTSGDILARFQKIAADATVSAIVLTDSHVFTVASVAQMQAMIASSQSTLAKIEGGYGFQMWSGVTGYRTLTHYDSSGKAVEAVTTSSDANGQITRIVDNHVADGSAYASERYQYTPGNKAMTYQAFDASGKMVVLAYTGADGRMTTRTVYNADGSSVADVYSATGQVTETITKANGTITRKVLPGTVDTSRLLFPTSPDAVQQDPTAAKIVAPTATITAGAKATAIAGTAAAGHVVSVSDAGKTIATGAVDASGHYALDVALGAGRHVLQVSSSSLAGQSSPTGEGIAIEVGTASDILGRLGTIAAAGVSEILLTDTHALTVASTAQMQSLIASSKAVLDKIDGGYTFQVASGPAANRTVSSYDSAGNALDAVTTQLDGSGRQTRVTEAHIGDGSPYAREVDQFFYSAAGKSVTHQAFDAAGNLVLMTQARENGSVYAKTVRDAEGNVTIDNFDTKGQTTSHIVTHADGSMDSVYINGASRNVVASRPDGWADTKYYQSDKLIAETTVHAKGDEISQEKWSYSGGQSTYTAYAGSKIVNTQHYATSGVMDSETRLAADGSTVAQTFDAAGAIKSEVTTMTSGETISKTFANGMLTQMTDSHPATKSLGAWSDVYAVTATSDGYSVKHTTTGAMRTTATTTSYASLAEMHGVNGLGGSGSDVLIGSNGADRLTGGSGDDRLVGNAGNDILIAGSGRDTMTGGLGADRYVFGTTAGQGSIASPSQILDFNAAQGDKIDLSAFSAKLDASHPIHLVSDFSGAAGEMTISGTGAQWTMALDLDGDHKPDFALAIAGSRPTAADFVL